MSSQKKMPPVQGTGDALQEENSSVLLAEDDSELEEE
jgi:hypothetical protein